MQSPVFFGEFELLLDSKNRLLVPVEVRRRVSQEHGNEAFFLVAGSQNRVPWLFPERYYEFLATQGRQSLLPDPNATAFYRMAFGMASLQTVDSIGRVLIPARTVDKTLIKDEKDLTLVGVWDHLELWPRQAWNNERERLLRAALESRPAPGLVTE